MCLKALKTCFKGLTSENNRPTCLDNKMQIWLNLNSLSLTQSFQCQFEQLSNFMQRQVNWLTMRKQSSWISRKYTFWVSRLIKSKERPQDVFTILATMTKTVTTTLSLKITCTTDLRCLTLSAKVVLDKRSNAWTIKLERLLQSRLSRTKSAISTRRELSYTFYSTCKSTT